ncbi:outer membrane protein, cobalt-zinc-cadmium efflux system [Bryocella elongata]|uniref:Outer membrane protein, cobalt-zinc-cadmium efflux system n=1 Tax=Bryocella elongata TaxID=863522 RepID=A0A1H5U5S7_9BACT|nr:TolC family protein [Bryocella elongata]SEF70376.1 outer membrane protein, cobalt-zinc-cadmium efflux system [Bryocella elongata]
MMKSTQQPVLPRMDLRAVLPIALVCVLMSATRATAQQPQSPSAPVDAQSVRSAAEAYAASAQRGADPRQAPRSKPGALTLQQAIDQAKAKNPTILAAEENLRAVRGQEIQAAVRANPYFTLYGTDVTENESASNPYNYSAQFSRLFERGQKRRWRMDDAKATSAQTEAQLNDQIRQTVLAVKQAFTKMLVAKEALELSTATLKDYRHEVEIGQDRYKAGDLAKLDYERLDLQLSSFESDQSNDIVTLQQASYQLQTLLGIDKPSDQFDVAGEVIPPVLAETKDSLEQKAIAARPDFAAAGFAVNAADANYKLAVANGTTDPTAEVEFDRAGTENTVGFSVNIPLRLFDRNQGNKQTAKFQASSARFTLAAARNQVTSDVDQAWVSYTEARRLSDRFSDRYLDESHDVLNISQYAFEHGGLTLIDYLDALREFRSSTTDALTAYQNTWLAIHQLSAASATELLP